MKAKSNQNIFDIVAQNFGNLDEVVNFAVDNDFTLNQDLPINQELNINNPVGVGNDNTKEAISTQALTFNNKRVSLPKYEDWFLPSVIELFYMYENLKIEGVGDFANSIYWASNDGDSTFGSNRDFTDGTTGGSLKSGTCHRVRAARSFVAEAGEYNLRDIGPAGGLIFFIDGSTTYYEAAPYDQSNGIIWSNIDTPIPLPINFVVGFGQSNTLAIINQAGHINSAAKICNDLII